MTLERGSLYLLYIALTRSTDRLTFLMNRRTNRVLTGTVAQKGRRAFRTVPLSSGGTHTLRVRAVVRGVKGHLFFMRGPECSSEGGHKRSNGLVTRLPTRWAAWPPEWS